MTEDSSTKQVQPVSAMRRVKLVLISWNMSLQALQNLIAQFDELVEPTITRSGTQFSISAQLPVDLSFQEILDQFAASVNGRFDGMGKADTYGVVRIVAHRGQSATPRALAWIRGGSNKSGQSTVNPRSKPIKRVRNRRPSSPISPARNQAVTATPVTAPTKVESAYTEPETQQVAGPAKFTEAIRKIFGGILVALVAVATALAIVTEPFTRVESTSKERSANESKPSTSDDEATS